MDQLVRSAKMRALSGRIVLFRCGSKVNEKDVSGDVDRGTREEGKKERADNYDGGDDVDKWMIAVR
jgi:hypothetical protein